MASIPEKMDNGFAASSSTGKFDGPKVLKVKLLVNSFLQ